MWMTLWALIALHTPGAEAACRSEAGAPDAPLSKTAKAAGVVVLEMRLRGQDPPPTAVLQALAERGLRATLLPTARWASTHPDALRAAVKAGHEVGYWVSLAADLELHGEMTAPPELADWVRGLRRARATVRKAVRKPVRVIGIETLPHVGEMAIEGLGFRAILPAERTVGDLPRRSESLLSAGGMARVIGEGPYADGCGAPLPAWTPAALDRATMAAASGSWVRISLPAADPDLPLLSRWLDKVVVAQDWSVRTATQAAREAKPGLAVRHDKASVPVEIVREVDAEAWTRVAEALVGGDTLARHLPGEITPTEAFLGLTTILAAEGPLSAVTLTTLSAPTETARRGLGARTIPLSADQVRQAARDLAPGLIDRVPSLVTVGNHGLTAAEFLRVMAQVHLGQDPVARATTDPDPFAPGGGWGQSPAR